MLTENLDRKSLERRITGLVGAMLNGLGWALPDMVQDLEVPEALASKLALNLDLLPAVEVVGRRPVPKELAVRVRDRGLEPGLGDCLGLDHVGRVRG